MSRAVEELAELIAEMPGIGPRQARRIVQFLLRTEPSYKKKLTEHIENISDAVTQCAQCYRYDEVRNKLCSLCADSSRDATQLMVVEKDVDVESIEHAGVFPGHYFVLGGLFSLARQRKNKIEPRTTALIKRLKGEDVKEVVLAFATTPEGDHTAQEVAKTIKDALPSIQVSQLGRGLSLGAEIEYADHETLKNAFRGRH